MPDTWKALYKWHLYNHHCYLFHTKLINSILFKLGLMATCEGLKWVKIMASFSFNKHLWIAYTYYGIVP